MSNKSGKIYRSFFEKKITLNYIYFGVYLIILLALNLYHVFLIVSKDFLPRFFFSLYAIGQTLIEVAAIVLIGGLIRRYLYKWVYYLYIAFTFLFLMANIMDFVLERVMDISFWFGAGIAFDETVENLIEILHLTGVDLKVWLLALPVVFVIPIAGVFFYVVTWKYAKVRPIRISHGGVLRLLCIFPICLLTLDVTSSHFLTEEQFAKFHMTLPWKATIVGFKKAEIELDNFIDPPKYEKEQLARLAAIPTTTGTRPNIYLFIAESVRADYIDETCAPKLTALARDNFSHHNSFSNANGTQLSWYSIFHSCYSFYWSAIQHSNWKSGSLPLQILKKMGYKVHIYSGAQLKYYALDRLMFGKNLEIADSMNIYTHYLPKEAWESDREATDKLLADLDQPGMEEGNVFVIFYDSSHFNYCWPPESKAPFKPYGMAFNSLRVTPEIGGIQAVKNRYRNSIYYLDGLYGEIQDKLEEKGLYDEALIVFTGDHGEEFLEEGQLYHASHLSRMQTIVPIYYKLGSTPMESSHQTTSHIDIFPTLLHYVSGDDRYSQLFDGESLMAKERRPFEVSARYNAGRTPIELFIHNGMEKLTIRFPCKNIFESRSIFIMSLKDAFDTRIDFESTDDQRDRALNLFSPAFSSLLK